jgi:hypothetical protein
MTFLTDYCEVINKKKKLRQLVQQTGLNYGSTHGDAKNELKLFSYKVSAVQQLKGADYQNKLSYCEWFTNFIAPDGEDILDVTFMRTKHGSASGHVNTKNAPVVYGKSSRNH